MALKYSLETPNLGILNSSREYTGEGKATYQLENGEIETFQGQFLNGTREGYGQYMYANGNTYKGNFSMDQKNGLGWATYIDQQEKDESEQMDIPPPKVTKYIGEFVLGYKSGNGTMQYANGDIYTGGWFKGKKHGNGRYTFKSDQSVIEGEWNMGYITYGRWIIPTGVYYIGKFSRNKPNGLGLWVFPEGTQIRTSYAQTVAKVDAEESNDMQNALLELNPEENLTVKDTSVKYINCIEVRE